MQRRPAMRTGAYGLGWWPRLLAASRLLLVLLVLEPAPPAVAGPTADETGAVAVLFRGAAGPVERATALARHAPSARIAASAASPDLALVRPPAGEASAVAARLRAEPAVRAAAPDRRLRVAGLPAEYSATAQPALARIAAPAAWAAGFSGAGVTLAIIDTGLDTSHPEFAGLVSAPAVFVSDPSPSFLCGATRREVSDDHGHGTHVAGIAAAGGDNGGLVGVAWGARLMPIKTLDACGVGTYYDMVQGVTHAIAAGARVVNLSLGGYLDATRPDDAALIALIQAAVDDARAAGVVIVAAAGNDGADLDRQPYYPAAAAGVVGVAATTLDDGQAGFSNRGAAVTVAAPGVAIVSTFPTYPVYLGVGPYGTLTGTSMAAPQVAGVAALLLERDPTLTPDDLAAVLAGTAVELGVPGRDPLFGIGRVDAGAALTRSAPAPLRLFAEGYTGAGFIQYLTIQNADTRPALARLDFHLADDVGGPARRLVGLPATSRTTLTINDLIGRERALGLTVAADSPSVYAERPIYFAYRLLDGSDRLVDGGHLGSGVATPAGRWFFAEGFTGAGFDTYLTILNPGADARPIRLLYYRPDDPPVERRLTVPPGARTTVAVHDSALGVGRGPVVSILAESLDATGIVVERPVYFRYRGSLSATGGHVVAGTPAPSLTWYFPAGSTQAGFDQYLALLNPGATAGTARLTYLVDGRAPIRRETPLPAERRTTITVHAPASAANPGGIGRGVAAAIIVESDVPIVVERPLYFTYRTGAGDLLDGGHSVLGATTPRARWHFAEGYTGAGFDLYLTILNPATDVARLRLTYYLDRGPPLVRDVSVPARGRLVIPVHDGPNGVGRDRAVSTTVDSLDGVGIVVERTAYFRYDGRLTGGHTAMGQ